MSVRDHQPSRPTRGLRNQLIIGCWVQRRSDSEPFQVKNVWRHEKRVQLVSDIPGSEPFALTFDEFNRGYRVVGS